MTDKNTIKRRSGYSSIPNATMSDARLSIEARGLLALMMTFANGWVFRASHLQKQCGVGKDKYQRMIREIKDAGYLLVEPMRSDEGKFEGFFWEIIDSGKPGKPEPENPASGKQGPLSDINFLSVNNNKTPKPPEGADLFSANETPDQKEPTVDHVADGIEQGFSEWWDKIWPSHKRKAARADCRKRYDQAIRGKHPKSDGPLSPQALNRATRAYIASVTDREFLKAPLAWLNQPGWEPFLDTTITYDEASLSKPALNLLKQGQCPPSMRLPDGRPNDEAAFHLKRFGFDPARCVA